MAFIGEAFPVLGVATFPNLTLERFYKKQGREFHPVSRTGRTVYYAISWTFILSGLLVATETSDEFPVWTNVAWPVIAIGLITWGEFLMYEGVSDERISKTDIEDLTPDARAAMQSGVLRGFLIYIFGYLLLGGCIGAGATEFEIGFGLVLPPLGAYQILMRRVGVLKGPHQVAMGTLLWVTGWSIGLWGIGTMTDKD